MNTIKIKHKIAVSCNGDLKKYFAKVEKVNKIISDKNFNFLKDEKFIHKLIEN